MIKIIIKESKAERVLSTSTELIKAFKTDSFYRKRILDDYSRFLFIPAFKKAFTKEQIKTFYDLFKESEKTNKPVTIFDILGYVRDVREYTISLGKFLDHISNEVGYYDPTGGYTLKDKAELFLIILDYIFSKKLREPNGKLVDLIILTQEKFYEKYNVDAPSLPILKRIGTGTSDAASKNLEFLRTNFQLSGREAQKFIEKAKILKIFKIKQMLGSGAYGKVYALDDPGYVIKIFYGGVYLEKDLKRMRRVVKQVYTGKAALEDMHYFDIGYIDKSSEITSATQDSFSAAKKIYFAIMPKIIPFASTEEYKKNENLYYILSSEIFYYVNNFGEITNYSDFERNVLRNLLKSLHFSFVERADKNILMSYIKAGYAAKTKFEGFDLHNGNIGYLPQKPDILFYFDM